MRLRHIGCIGKAGKISAVVVQPEPRRGHDIDPLGYAERLGKILTPDFLKHLMKREVDHALLLDIVVHKLLKSRIACPLSLLFPLQKFIFHIADIGIRCLDLRPVFHLLKHRHQIACCQMHQNITLDAALIAQRRLFGDRCLRVSTPLRIDLHVQRLIVHQIVKIDVLLHIVRSDIERVALIERRLIVKRLPRTGHIHHIAVLPNANLYDIGVCRKQQHLLDRIYIKTVCKVLLDR